MTGGLDLDDARVAVTTITGAGAVKASRVPTAPDDLDYFPTPPWAARAGGELLEEIASIHQMTCWEPAAGGGHMAFGLRDYFASVVETDLHDYGGGNPVMDFLSPRRFLVDERPFDWVVTNPPFVKGEAFIRRAYAHARRGVAMLLRLQFIEGAARHQLFTQDCPLTVLAPFCERVPMVKGRWDPEASSATAYAWFIFDKLAPAGPPEVRFVPPGSRERLTRPGDRAKFGLAETGALDL